MTRTLHDIVDEFSFALRQANLGHSALGASGKIPGSPYEWSNRSKNAVKGAMIQAMMEVRKNARDLPQDQGHLRKLQSLLDEFAEK